MGTYPSYDPYRRNGCWFGVIHQLIPSHSPPYVDWGNKEIQWEWNGPFENRHLSPELRQKAVTAGTVASNFPPCRVNPDLPREHRVEFRDEANIEKSRMEKPYRQWVKPHLKAVITLVFSATYSRMVFCCLANYQSFLSLATINSNRHANYVLGTTQSPN